MFGGFTKAALPAMTSPKASSSGNVMKSGDFSCSQKGRVAVRKYQDGLGGLSALVQAAQAAHVSPGALPYA